jgi:hypothetical protein
VKKKETWERVDNLWPEPPKEIVRKSESEIRIENVPAIKVLKEYPYFATRMVYLLERMEKWNPRTFRQLFVPSYGHRRDWFLGIFGLFFGLVSIISLVLLGYQKFIWEKGNWRLQCNGHK